MREASVAWALRIQGHRGGVRPKNRCTMGANVASGGVKAGALDAVAIHDRQSYQPSSR
jgi:hypothetical protein